jgi:hypothetical protein
MKFGGPKREQVQEPAIQPEREPRHVASLSNKIPKPQPAFHASPVGDISEFKPLSHFGSQKAAEDRAQRFIREGKEVRLYDVELRINNPLRIKDLPKSVSYSAVHSPFRIGEMLYYDIKPRVITDAERVAMLGANDDQQRAEKLIEILESKGYDGIVYENRWEDPGSLSWIIFHPDQVVIR